MVIGERKKNRNVPSAWEIYWCDKIIKINKTCTILNWCVIFIFEGNYETNLKAYNIFSYFTLKLKTKKILKSKKKKSKILKSYFFKLTYGYMISPFFYVNVPRQPDSGMIQGRWWWTGGLITSENNFTPAGDSVTRETNRE